MSGTTNIYFYNGAKVINGVIADINGNMTLVTSDILTDQEVIDLASIVDKIDSDDAIALINQAESNANAYTDSKVVGLLDLRGSFTPSGSYPSTGGSGIAGSILKGDTWIVSGLLYHQTEIVGSNLVANKYTLTAIEDNPLQDDSKWLVIANDSKGETHVSGLTSTGDITRTGKWYKVFEYALSNNFENSCFKLLMNEGGNSNGGGSSVEFDIILKRQDPNKFVNININSFDAHNEFILTNFDVLWNDTTKILSFYYKPTNNFMTTEWNILGSEPLSNSARISWVNNYLGVTSLSGETNDTIFEKNITLSSFVSKDTFPYHDSFVASDLTTAITAVVFDYKMMLKFNVTLTSFIIDLQTAQTSGSIITFDILKNGVSVLSTLATIDNGEKSTLTATTPMVISGGQVSFSAGDVLSIQCTQVGDGTAKCVTATAIGTRSI